MKVFISWSGERSQSLAQALRDWLPMVLFYAEPWLSNSDIEAGERWAAQVAKELEATKLGLICVTRENINSPWLLFEAGALAKSMKEGRVVPLLFDIEFKDITGPLAQFQAKKLDKLGLSDVIRAINSYADAKVAESRLNLQFEALWPALEKKVSEIPKDPAVAKFNRPQSEVLEELVTSIRGLDVRFRETMEVSSQFRRKKFGFHPMMLQEMLHRSEFGRQDPMRFLLLGSILRDEFPWLYELGLDTYRAASSGNPGKYSDSKRRFFAACRDLQRGPFLEMMHDKESHFVLREMMHLVESIELEDTIQDRTELVQTKRDAAPAKK